MTIFKGVKALGGHIWAGSLQLNEKDYHLGFYDDEHEAALGYDMEMLRLSNLIDIKQKLNFDYKILPDSRGENKILVTDSSGFEFSVTLCSDIQSYEPITLPPPPSSSSDLFNKKFINSCHPLISEGAPPRSSLIRPWLTRVTTSYTPTASFCYEITFPHQNALGLSLKPKSIFYSSAGSNKFMGTLVVEESQALLSTVVYPGDILLRINDTNLTNFGDHFDFETATNLVTSSASPRVVRFLRPLGPDHTLSPAEVSCFLSLPSSSICQSTCPPEPINNEPIKTEMKGDQQGPSDETSGDVSQFAQSGAEEEKSEKSSLLPDPIAKFNVVVNAATSSQSLHLMSLDSQAPAPIKKIMQGGKVIWETPPAASAPSAQGNHGKVGSKTDIALAEANAKLRREVYREATGPASVSSVTTTGSYAMGGKNSNKRSILAAFDSADTPQKELKRVFLGRFESEDDAISVVRMAKQEWNSLGTFTPRRLIPPPRPGAYINSMQGHGGGNPQSYGNYAQMGRVATAAPQQYSNQSSGTAQQMKQQQQQGYYNPNDAKGPTSMSPHPAAGSNLRTQTMPSTQPHPQHLPSGGPGSAPSMSGQQYYPSFFPPRGVPQTATAAPLQQQPSMGSYLQATATAPRASYPLLGRPGEASQFPSQGLPPYHLPRSSTAPHYPADFSSNPDGQVMYLSPAASALSRGQGGSLYPPPTGLPPQLPSLPRQLP